MTEEFKSFIKDCKKSIMFYTISYLIIFILLKLIVNLLGFEFMQYIYDFSISVIAIGVIAGIIQIFIKSKSKDTRICIVICSISIVILIGIFSPIIMLLFVTFHPPEHIAEKDNKKYVAHVHAFLDTRVQYYDYVNFLLRGTTKRIEDNYNNIGIDVLDKKNKGLYTPSYTYYYNDEGKILNKNRYTAQNNMDTNKNNETKYNENMEQQNKQSENMQSIVPMGDDSILYKKDNVIIQVRYLGAVLAQRSVVSIDKSIDGGKTFTSMNEQGITINEGAELIFTDENTGFINDPGTIGTAGDNRRFLVSNDGGITFKKANIIHPDSIAEKNLLVKGLPYMENGKLKLEVYTLNHAKNPKRTYYIFNSIDNGCNWNLERKKD